MSLPRSVREQADAANTIQEQLNTPATPDTIPNPAAEPATQDPVVEQQEPAAAQSAPEPQQETRDATYWRHRFDVLQGKYNAEVPALRKEINALNEELKATDRSPESAAKRAHEAVAELTEAEVEEFGPDLVNLIKRVVGNVGGSEDVEGIKNDLSQLKDERQQDATARFWTDLEIQVPDFRAINADSAFHGWLAEHDPLSGKARQDLLVSAQQALDPYRVAAIFKSFAGASQKSPQPAVPDDQVHPRQTRAAAPEPQPGKIWAREEITRFYREKSSYPKEEAAAIEADIFAAQSQGRIR